MTMRPGTFITAALLLIVAAASLLVGTYPVSFSQLTASLSGGASDIVDMVVLHNRLPRLLCAIGAGAAFGIAGAITQAMLRNPLASPDIVGFNAGAGLGAVMAVAFFGGGAMILLGALIGALAAAAFILVLSWDGGIRPYRLILIGVGTGLTLTALSDVLMSRIDILSASELSQWLIGNLRSRDWSDVTFIAAALALLLLFIPRLEFVLARLMHDDDTATGWGMDLGRARAFGLFVSVALVAAAITVAGPLPFVAFVAGPIARGRRNASRPMLIRAGLVGALVTAGADLIARVALGNLFLPTGVFTALIGAPVLLWILSVQFRKGQF